VGATASVASSGAIHAAGEGMAYHVVVPGVSHDGPPPTPAPIIDGLDREGGAMVVELINSFRRENGLPALPTNQSLQRAAEKYARMFISEADIKNLSVDSHYLDGTDQDRANREGYKGVVNENLAWHLAPGTKEQWAIDIVEGWKASPGHRSNMLGQIWKNFGVGCVVDTVPANRLPGRTSTESIRIVGCIADFGNGD
jgi:uncharacterized protein YkwD